METETAERRVREAKADLRQWTEKAFAEIFSRHPRRIPPQNPATYKALGVEL